MATIVVFLPNPSPSDSVSNRSVAPLAEPGRFVRGDRTDSAAASPQATQLNDLPKRRAEEPPANSDSFRPMSKRNSDAPGWLRCLESRDRLGCVLPSGSLTSVAPPDKRSSDMPTSTYFLQECPTCGRRVEVRVEYLGRRVYCDHCNGRFVAEDPNGVESGSVAMSGRDLIARANRLLQAVEARQARTA